MISIRLALLRSACRWLGCLEEDVELRAGGLADQPRPERLAPWSCHRGDSRRASVNAVGFIGALPCRSVSAMGRNLTTDFFRWLSALELLPHRFRPALLRRGGVQLGRPILLMAGVHFVRYSPITLGDDVFINYGTYFDAEAEIRIGDGTQIGDHVRVVTSTHELGDGRRRAGKAVGMPVVIGSGVWIGSGSTILPGITIGDGAVIAAGSIVREDCRPDTLYAGVPAIAKKLL